MLSQQNPEIPRCSGQMLLKTALHWNLDSLCGPSLLPPDICHIPRRFDSSVEWFNTFYPFLLEDLRCDLKGLIESYGSDDDGGLQFLHPLIELIGIGSLNPIVPGHLSFEINEPSEKSYIAKNVSGLALFIRGNFPTQLKLEDILKNTEHFFVHVDSPLDPKKPLTFKCQFPQKACLAELQKSNCHNWKLVVLDNHLASLQRVCDALGRRVCPSFMEDILRGKVHEQLTESLENQEPLGNLEDLSSLPHLNESQRLAISRVLQVGIPHHPRIQIIQGPPGTGKTRTITSLIDVLTASNLRVHATAPTNIAVTELAKRFISNSPNKKTLIIGTLSRLKLPDELLQYHLDTKATKIQKSIIKCSHIQMQLKDLLLLDPTDPSNRIHQRFQGIMKLLQACFSVFMHDTPAGLMTHQLSDEDIVKLEYLISAPKDEFLEWFHDRVNGVTPNSEKTFPLYFNEVIASLRSISINATHLKNLKGILLSQAEVFFSTVNVGGREIFSLIPIDVSIVDEATQLLQGDIATMFRSDLKCLVLVGDDKQLPAVVTSDQCRRLGYGVSLFERLISLRYPFTLLNVQYRMHPLISSWPSEQFYSGQILNGENVLSEAYRKSWHRDLSPLELYDVPEGSEGSDGPSLFHETQAAVVRGIMTAVMKHALKESNLSIGIISPYKKQISLLSHLALDSPNLKIKVCTIDGFQGQECDVIILTTVRSNPDRRIGFLSDLRRLNVGITRSKYSMILVGDVETISSNDAWKGYADYLKGAGKIHRYQTSHIIRNAVNSLINKSSNAFPQEAPRLQLAPHSLATSLVFQETLWGVSFDKEFPILQQGKHKDQITRKLLSLAQGDWLKRESKSNVVSTQFEDIIHVQRIQTGTAQKSHSFLLWTVDVDQQKRVQCLKFWNLVETSLIPKVVRRIELSYRNYSEFYLNCCKRTPLRNAATKRFEPHVLDNQDGDIVWYKQIVKPLVKQK